MRDAHQNVPMVALPGPPAGGLFNDLFSSNSRTPQQAQSQNTLTPSDTAPVPPASIGQQPARSTNGTGGGSLDGWLINNLFGKRG